MELAVPSVCERDIDLLLLEELVASADFLSWFTTRLGLRSPAQLSGASCCVVAANGESDLEIRLASDGRVVQVLIENKIDAMFQPRQAERYAERAAAYRASGSCDQAITVLIAPRDYAGSESETCGFDCRFSHEDVLTWFRANQALGRRGEYKRALLEQALARAATGWTLVPDDATSAFWVHYWQLASAVAPELELPFPAAKPASSGWFYFKPAALPSGVQLLHKAPYGHVDLQFKGMGDRLPDIRARYEPLLESGMRIARANKSAAIRMTVSRVNLREPFESAESAVRDGIRAAQRLLSWFTRLESGWGAT